MTRADVEGYMVKRLGKILAFVQLDGLTIDGTNPDLNDPIADALESQSITPANRVAVTDGDVGQVNPIYAQWFLRMVELRTLRTIQNQFIYYSETFVDNEEKIVEVRRGVETRADCLEMEIKNRWGERQSGFFVGPVGQPIPTSGQPSFCPPVPVCGRGPLVDLTKFNP